VVPRRGENDAALELGEEPSVEIGDAIQVFRCGLDYGLGILCLLARCQLELL
jgi:hypothetical protein